MRDKILLSTAFFYLARKKQRVYDANMVNFSSCYGGMKQKDTVGSAGESTTIAKIIELTEANVYLENLYQ